jgi:hypothetical protein
MSTGWNYSDLSRLAKMNGGPEMLISKIKAGSFQSGLAAGRKESLPWIVISALIAGGVLVYEEGPKLVKAVKNKISNKAVVEEAEAAEEILIKEIKEAEEADEGSND